MNDVTAWLHELGLACYADLFAREAIDAEVLRDLTDADLAGLGIPLGHRKRLLRAVAQLGTLADETGREPQPVATGWMPPSELGASGASQGANGPGANGLPGPERRSVSVAFCDLVGSTSLARQLDPEDLRTVIRAYQDCCAEVVARLDGYVCRHVGDGIVIYFGYPRAHEDDAERAVRAGLEISARVARLACGAEGGLRTRVGITTGLVIVGDWVGSGPAQEMAAMGDPLNIASRLQGFAEPGGVVVDRTTWALTAGLFTFQDLGERWVRGVEEPVRVWSVTGERGGESRFAALRGPRIVPFVARETELATLQVAWDAARRGTGQVVVISGEPGIGKSRLVEVFESRLAGRTRPAAYARLTLQASPYHRSTALHPFVEHVESAAGLGPGDDTATKLDKIVAFFRGRLDRAGAQALFAALLSLPAGPLETERVEAPSRRETAFRILVDHFTRSSAARPLMIVVEDAHWLDPTSIDLLDAIADRIGDLHAMLLVTQRPEKSPALTARGPLALIQLDRLRRADCRAMVAHLAQGRTVSPDLVEAIVTRADGVPLFVEELTKSVFDSDAVIQRSHRIEIRAGASGSAIPTTLAASLAVRLDRHPQSREIAQVGAVIGRGFTLAMVTAVSRRPEAAVRRAIEALLGAELLLRDPESVEEAFRFKHALVRDAAYESLLISRRRELHGRVAEVIETRFPDVAATQPALLAEHAARAGLTEKAVSYCVRAGRLALLRSAMAEAITSLRMGLDLVPKIASPEEARRAELELQVLSGHAFRAARAPSAPETGAAWDRARALCGPHDVAFLRQVLYGQFLYHQGNAFLDRARHLGEELLALEAREGDSGAFVRGHSAVGRAAFGQGDFTAARRHLEQALSAPAGPSSRAAQGPEARVLNLCYLAWTLFIQGRVGEGETRARESIAEAERMAAPYYRVVAYGNACYGHHFRRDLPAVAAAADTVTALAEERGFPAWLSLGRIFRGWVLVHQGDIAAGLPLIEEALAEHRDTGEVLEVPYLMGLLAECHGEAGRPEDGLTVLEEALALSARTGEAWYDAELHRMSGAFRLGAGPNDPSEALACFERAVALARRQGALTWELRAALGLARHWHAALDAERLRAVLRPVVAAFGTAETFDDLDEARHLLEEASRVAATTEGAFQERSGTASGKNSGSPPIL